MPPQNNNIKNPSPDFEDFFRSTPCYLCVYDADFRIMAFNKNFENDFGDAAGRFCYQVCRQRSEKCADCPVEQTFSDSQPHITEHELVLPNGRALPIVAITSPVIGPSGVVDAVIQISADITLVKRLETQLLESRERFRLLFNESPSYISVQDRDLCIVEANRRFKEDFGDFEGAPCYEIYKHRKEQCLHCPVAATFHDGKSHYSEEVVTSLSGEQISTLVYTAPIRDAEGEIETVMEMSTNITQIRSLQGQLTNLGMLVGSISHGLKGLLMSLDGGMYMLKTGMEKNKPERLEEGWRQVQRNVEHIRRVVLDLLYMAGDSEPRFEPVPLHDLARAVAGHMQKRAQDLQIDFQVELGCEGETCELDLKSMKGSLVNILENAFEACRIENRRESLFVRFSLTSDQDNVVFLIEDNGLGMDRESLEKIFSLSFTSTGKKGGKLGLFTANKVIEKHGGIIEVKSEPDKGSTFHIRIPKVRAGRQD